MPTYILTWNPKRWEWDDIDDYVAATKAGKTLDFDWSTGSRKSVQTGDRLFLFRQSTDRGLIGSGVAVSNSYRKPHWDARRESVKDEQNAVDVRWDTVLSASEVLPVSALENESLGVPWNVLLGSGVAVPIESEDRLEELWEQHLRSIGRRGGYAPPEILANEVVGEYAEGAVYRIEVNAYERNACARQRCIDHYGLDCAICGFNFGDAFGELGEGYIHVHHLRSLSAVGKKYVVDPVADLRPICPNCHAMIHRKSPLMSIEALRNIVRTHKRRNRRASR